MRQACDRDFLLRGATARALYHDHAAALPHVGLYAPFSAERIAKNEPFSNIAELWLYGESAVIRAMRAMGVAQDVLAPDASDYEKFSALCGCMYGLAGHPLYEQLHLELARSLGCTLPICPAHCDEIFAVTANRLTSPDLAPRAWLARMGAGRVFTVQDPADTLPWHERIKDEGTAVAVAPVFRADAVLDVSRRGYAAYLGVLGEACGVQIRDLASLYRALCVSLDRFCEMGCVLALHGAASQGVFVRPDEYHAGKALSQLLAGERPSEQACDLLRAQLCRFLGLEYVRRGIVMQVLLDDEPFAEHVANKREYLEKSNTVCGVNAPMELGAFLAYLETQAALPQVVLCATDPARDASLARVCAAFGSVDGIPRVWQGFAPSPYTDARGMRDRLRTFLQTVPAGALLPLFGDGFGTRLSVYCDVYRRLLCDLLGTLSESGAYASDRATCAALVKNACGGNAARLLGE